MDTIIKQLQHITSMRLFWSFAKIRAEYADDIQAYKNGKKSYRGALLAKRKVYEDTFAALPCNIKATATDDLEDEKVVLTLVTDWSASSEVDGEVTYSAPGRIIDLKGKSDEEATKEIWKLAILMAWGAQPYKATVVHQTYKM